VLGKKGKIRTRGGGRGGKVHDCDSRRDEDEEKGILHEVKKIGSHAKSQIAERKEKKITWS